MTAMRVNFSASFDVEFGRLKSPLQNGLDEMRLKLKIVATVSQQLGFDSSTVGANSFSRIRLNLIHATR